MHQLPDDSVQQITFSVTLPSEVETVGIGIGTEVEEHKMFSSRTVEGIFGRAGQLAVHKVLYEPVIGMNEYTCCDADQFDHLELVVSQIIPVDISHVYSGRGACV